MHISSWKRRYYRPDLAKPNEMRGQKYRMSPATKLQILALTPGTIEFAARECDGISPLWSSSNNAPVAISFLVPRALRTAAGFRRVLVICLVVTSANEIAMSSLGAQSPVASVSATRPPVASPVAAIDGRYHDHGARHYAFPAVQTACPGTTDRCDPRSRPLRPSAFRSCADGASSLTIRLLRHGRTGTAIERAGALGPEC